MRDKAPNLLLFIAMTLVAGGLFWAGDKYIWPPKPKPPAPLTIPREAVGALAGSGILAAPPYDVLPSVPPPKPVAPPTPPPLPKPAELRPSEPRALIALGDESFFLKVLLTNKGGGVQQVVLTQFDEASRLGREIPMPDGKPRPLHLIPGYQRPWSPELVNEPPYVDLVPNYTPGDLAAKAKPKKLPFEEALLSRPSYVLFHYPSRDDPARLRGEDGQIRPEDDNYPVTDLGERTWSVAAIEQPAGGTWKVVFETELAAPYYLKLRKTFTLAPKEYDFKLSVDIEPLPEHKQKTGQFRYQLQGPLGMPIEGEWYTSTHRTAFAGWTDADQHQKRSVEDPASIHAQAGGEKKARFGTFNYAAIGTQFFASAMAVDGVYTEQNQPWEYVRATREQLPAVTRLDGDDYQAEKAFLYDITVRAVTPLYDLAATESIHHQYAIYNGPIKVRLLKQLEGTRAVDEAIVDRYLNQYHLDTMTDFHSPTWFSRNILHAIFWTDIVITSTNIMHRLLGFLHSLVGSWGLSIMLTTMLVKLCLIVPSRRQQAINANMQARIATIKPELDALNAKYKGDIMAMQPEKTKLFRKAGIKQSHQMGGCLLLFAQMPILMGLYFCLQESVFFRLTPFLWMQNLAAPDMLIWWGEQIPFLSTPSARFGSFSFLYLGPFFNALPMAAVFLFYMQQKITMPPPTNEVEETQRKMMKYMLVFSALFFYKVASGLCVYFIVSGLWSLLERKLVPKPKPGEIAPLDEDEPKPQGWLARKLADAKTKMEEMQKQAEGQRQIRNEPKPNLDNLSRNERRAQKRKKK